MKRKRYVSLILVFVLAFSLIPYASAADHDDTFVIEEHSCDEVCLTHIADPTIYVQPRIIQVTCPKCGGVAVQEADWTGAPQLTEGHPHGDHLDYDMYRTWMVVISCGFCNYSNQTTQPLYYGNWCPNA